MSVLPYRTVKRARVNPFQMQGSMNVIEANAQSFDTFRGYSRVQIDTYNGTTLSSSFIYEINGGLGTHTWDPSVGPYTILDLVNCTQQLSIVPNQFRLVNSTDGRIYEFTYFGYSSTPPTIQKIGGSALNGPVVVTVTDYIHG